MYCELCHLSETRSGVGVSGKNVLAVFGLCRTNYMDVGVNDKLMGTMVTKVLGDAQTTVGFGH